jgi:hypothetical protein
MAEFLPKIAVFGLKNAEIWPFLATSRARKFFVFDATTSKSFVSEGTRQGG